MREGRKPTHQLDVSSSSIGAGQGPRRCRGQTDFAQRVDIGIMVDYYDVDGEKDMNCPECGDNAIPFVKAWIAGPWFHLSCPGCHAKLKVHKAGLSRFSSYVIGVSISILIVLGKFGVCWNPTVFVSAAILLLTLDFFIDRKFVVLKKTPCGIRTQKNAPVASNGAKQPQ